MTTNLKEQLRELVELQKIDAEIYTLLSQKESFPDEIKKIEQQFESKKQSLAAAEKKFLDVQKEKKERELELGANEENRKKLQAQLYALKTNKEYQAMLQQISDSKADASVIEDKILQSMEAIDAVKAEVDSEKQKISGEEKICNDEKKKIQDKINILEDRIAQLNGQRQQLLPKIDPKLLTHYEKILSNKGGLALASVKDYSCQGCHMSATPQTVNLIKMYDHIITCEMCARILYIEEDFL